MLWKFTNCVIFRAQLAILDPPLESQPITLRFMQIFYPFNNPIDKMTSFLNDPREIKFFYSKFQGTWGMANTMYETLIYAHMKTFRFTGTPALYIECDIRMCHGRCPVSLCQSVFIDRLFLLAVFCELEADIFRKDFGTEIEI